MQALETLLLVAIKIQVKNFRTKIYNFKLIEIENSGPARIMTSGGNYGAGAYYS